MAYVSRSSVDVYNLSARSVVQDDHAAEDRAELETAAREVQMQDIWRYGVLSVTQL